MSDDACDNDCVAPLRFPRRPGDALATVHGENCSCCVPSARVSSDNRPALPHFNYRIGTYGTIREWLLHWINQTPELRSWTHRAPDDPAIALLEGASILGDILTFYQETYANEAFLRTAQWRESIGDLVRLLGYRLSPAIGGNATFAFELKKDEPVVVPAGFPLKATLAEMPAPSTFETLEAMTAYPWLNRFNLYRPLVQHDIVRATSEFWISLPEQLLSYVELKPGDRLMLGELIGRVRDPAPFFETIELPEPVSLTAALILTVSGEALVDANTALEAARAEVSADAALIEKAKAAAEVAASEAAMQAVNQELEELQDQAQEVVEDATAARTATTDVGTSAGRLNRIMRATSHDRSLVPGITDADFQAVIATVDRDALEVEDAVARADSAASTSNSAVPGVRAYIGSALFGIGTLGLAASTATQSEAASKEADRVARLAAENAIRLAAIAQSSAAAGAADRVEASSLADEANTLAATAVTQAGEVRPAIANAKVQTGVAYGLAFAAVPIDPISSGIAAAALVVANNAADAALREADESNSAAGNVKGKVQQIVDTLSDSATGAAQKSVEDRRLAVEAVDEANRLAGLAHTAAETMKRDRADLISKINEVVSRAMTLQLLAEACVAAIEALIRALEAVDLETLRESILSGGATAEDAPGRARFGNAEIVIVDAVREQHGRKIFKIKGELKRGGTIGQLAAFKLGRTFHHFGFNGPPTTTKTSSPLVSTATTHTVDGRTTTTVTNPPIPEKNVAFSRFLAGITHSQDNAVRLPDNPKPTRICDPPLGKREFPLDAELNDLARGATLIVTATLFGSPNTSTHRDFTFVRTIVGTKPVVQTWGLVTGGTTLVTFDQPMNVYEDSVRYRIADIRELAIHEAVSPLLTVKRALEETTAARGTTLNFFGTSAQAETLAGRRLLLERVGEPTELLDASGVDSTSAPGTEAFAQLHAVTFPVSVPYTDFPNVSPTVTAFGNVVDADEGKMLPEVVLGNGNASAVFQNFKLPKAPLTYLIASGNTPPETPEISVYVGGREWQRVDSLFGRGADEHVYIVREDAAGNSWVQFGDGKTGARLPNGVGNVTAVQRLGAGSFGPLKEDTKVQALAKLKNLDKVQMPDVVTGGAPPESGDNAREAAPARVQSLGRMVSLEDFEAEAAAIPGVARAGATWQLEDNLPAVTVTVLLDTGRSGEVNSVRDHILDYNTQRGAGRTSITVLEGRRLYVAASVQYALKPGYRADLVEPEIRRALGVNTVLPVWQEDQTGLFSLRRRRFGAREYASSIEGVTQNVDGVLWAKAVAFTALSDVDAPTNIVLPGTAVLEPVVVCDAQHVLSLFDVHLTLTAVAALAN